jgi:radical SAM superfamily enzyme YgiQ (UPF0313 family)
MRIALVPMLNLPGDHQLLFTVTQPYVPLGILSLVSCLRREGWPDVVVPDLNYEVERRRLQLDSSFYDACVEILLESEADIYGFGTTCGDYLYALNFAKRIKAVRKDAVILFGGPQATIFADETLERFPFVDFVLSGESEASLPRLAALLHAGGELATCPGLTYRHDGTVRTTPRSTTLVDMDDLPFPAYDLYRDVLYESEDTIPLDVGRGCPFSCTFCSTSLFWKRTYRLKSATKLLGEIRTLMHDYHVRRFQFPHDMFTFDKRKVLAFCNAIVEANIDIDWLCSARIDCVDDELLSAMKAAGCFRIHYGIETGSESMQRRIQKHLKLADVHDTIDKTLDHGIRPKCTFMVGFPDETMEELRETVDLFADLNSYFRTEAYLGQIACLPATPLYESQGDTLEFDDFITNDFVCNMLIDDEAKTLITTHKDMFSAYYHLKTEFIGRDLLKFISVLRLVAFDYPRTLTLLASELGLIDELYDYWREWSRTHRIRITLSWYVDQVRVMEDFKQFVLYLVGKRRIESPYIADVMEYEAMLFTFNVKVEQFDSQRRIRRLKGERILSDKGCHPASAPQVDAPTPVVKEFDYNMLKLMTGLERGSPEEVGKERTVHLFHAKDHVGVHVMTFSNEAAN